MMTSNLEHAHVKMFLETCNQHVPDYRPLIESRIKNAIESFVVSENCKNLLTHTTQCITNEPRKLFILIRDCLNVFKENVKSVQVNSHVNNKQMATKSSKKRKKHNNDDDFPSNKVAKYEGANHFKSNHEHSIKDERNEVTETVDDEYVSQSAKIDTTIVSKYIVNHDHPQISPSAETCSSHLLPETNVTDDISNEINVNNSDVGNEISYVKKVSKSDAGKKTCNADDISNAVPSCSKINDDLQSDEKTVCKKGSLSQLRRLEKLLEKLTNEIARTREQELTFDDMDQEDSYYIYEDKLKAKLMKVWRKICEIKGASETTGRRVDAHYSYQGTRYPELNRRVSRFVNKTHTFPDYHDILSIVRRVNEKHTLQLSEPKQERLAREVFENVGTQLKRRRQQDLQESFASDISTQKQRTRVDPAEADPDLQRKLSDNRKLGLSRMDDVIEKYTKKATEIKISGGVTENSSEDESEEESDARSETRLSPSHDDKESESGCNNSETMETEDPHKVVSSQDEDDEQSDDENNCVSESENELDNCDIFNSDKLDLDHTVSGEFNTLGHQSVNSQFDSESKCVISASVLPGNLIRSNKDSNASQNIKQTSIHSFLSKSIPSGGRENESVITLDTSQELSELEDSVYVDLTSPQSNHEDNSVGIKESVSSASITSDSKRKTAKRSLQSVIAQLSQQKDDTSSQYIKVSSCLNHKKLDNISDCVQPVTSNLSNDKLEENESSQAILSNEKQEDTERLPKKDFIIHDSNHGNVLSDINRWSQPLVVIDNAEELSNDGYSQRDDQVFSAKLKIDNVEDSTYNIDDGEFDARYSNNSKVSRKGDIGDNGEKESSDSFDNLFKCSLSPDGSIDSTVQYNQIDDSETPMLVDEEEDECVNKNYEESAQADLKVTAKKSALISKHTTRLHSVEDALQSRDCHKESFTTEVTCDMETTSSRILPSQTKNFDVNSQSLYSDVPTSKTANHNNLIISTSSEPTEIEILDLCSPVTNSSCQFDEKLLPHSDVYENEDDIVLEKTYEDLSPTAQAHIFESNKEITVGKSDDISNIECANRHLTCSTKDQISCSAVTMDTTSPLKINGKVSDTKDNQKLVYLNENENANQINEKEFINSPQSASSDYALIDKDTEDIIPDTPTTPIKFFLTYIDDNQNSNICTPTLLNVQNECKNGKKKSPSHSPKLVIADHDFVENLDNSTTDTTSLFCDTKTTESTLQLEAIDTISTVDLVTPVKQQPTNISRSPKLVITHDDFVDENLDNSITDTTIHSGRHKTVGSPLQFETIDTNCPVDLVTPVKQQPLNTCNSPSPKLVIAYYDFDDNLDNSLTDTTILGDHDDTVGLPSELERIDSNCPVDLVSPLKQQLPNVSLSVPVVNVGNLPSDCIDLCSPVKVNVDVSGKSRDGVTEKGKTDKNEDLIKSAISKVSKESLLINKNKVKSIIDSTLNHISYVSRSPTKGKVRDKKTVIVLSDSE